MLNIFVSAVSVIGLLVVDAAHKNKELNWYCCCCCCYIKICLMFVGSYFCWLRSQRPTNSQQ
jgi:hypothetical protein